MKTESSLLGVEGATRPTSAQCVSVVIPAYNAAAFLAQTLQSILDQSTPPGEIIVVDDGSIDDTVAVARSFSSVTVICLENSGPGAARNAGIAAASGEYIALMDADDLWASDKLEVQLAALETFGRPAFSFTDYRIFDDKGFLQRESELWRIWAFRKTAGSKRNRDRIIVGQNHRKPIMYDTCFIAPSSVLVRRADVLAVGSHNEALRYCEDYELFLRLFRLMPAVVIMKPLLFYRRHAQQGTQKTAVKMKAGHFDVARLVAASPEQYPVGDVRYITKTDFLRHQRMAVVHARLGNIEESVGELKLSLNARWTASAGLMLIGSRIAMSPLGGKAFRTVRSLWRRRPSRR